jgi:hypothetical protein
MTVLYSDTITAIKERIHKIDGTPMDRTELKSGTKILIGTKTVTQLGLKEGSVIKLLYTTVKVKV